MGKTKTEDLSQDLTGLVRSIAGVDAVYATRPVAITALSVAVRTVTGAPTVVHLVSVEADGAGTKVFASIGSAASEPAPLVGARVHDAIEERLIELGVVPTVIDVTIGSVG